MASSTAESTFSNSTNEQATINQHLTTAERFERESNSNYSLRGRDINERRSQPDRRQLYFRALRELNQKRIQRDRERVRIANHYRRVNANGITQWECPRCHTLCRRLTAAHVGRRASDIIYEVLDHHPDERDILELDNYVRHAHDDVNLVVVCDPCNKLFDDN